MKIGFICPNVPGHLNPMTALARQFQARSHEVVFLYSPAANGLPCLPGDKNDDLNANRPEMSKLEGDSAIAFYCGVAAKETELVRRLDMAICRTRTSRAGACSNNTDLDRPWRAPSFGK
jgi:hypothetical protein